MNVDAVVLVHGLFGPFGDERLWSALAPRTTLHPDLIGYGAGAANLPPGADEISVDAQVAHLAETLGPDPAHLVGHSVGGVIAAVYADRFPERVLSFTSVEGNFAPADAFWSAELARLPAAEVAALLERYRADPAAWWAGDTTATTDPDTIRAARTCLDFQPPVTVQAMARSVVEVTARAGWPALLRRLFDAVPVHLIAGERSRADWHVPDWAVRAATTLTVVEGAGHAVMFDRPTAFAEALIGALPPLDLAGVRTRIDAVDADLVALLARRESLVRRAAPLKADAAAVRDPGRVADVLDRVRRLAVIRGASPDTVERIYRELIAAYIDLEHLNRG